MGSACSLSWKIKSHYQETAVLSAAWLDEGHVGPLCLDSRIFHLLILPFDL